MRNYIYYFIVLLIFLPSVAFSATVAEADSAYNAGNYEKAIGLYEDVISEQGTSAEIWFNLGNAFFQTDNFGKAMLCYQRARKLSPGNKEINNNINYLAGKIEDANKAEQRGKRLNTAEDEMTFFQAVHKSVAADVTSNTWAVCGAVAFILFSLCVALYIFSRNVLLRKTGFFGGFILLGISMICVVFAYMAAGEYHSKEYGVMQAYKSTLLTQPGADSPTPEKSVVLTRGTKVRIVSEETNAEGTVTWYKIRLNSDYMGWVSAEDVEII